MDDSIRESFNMHMLRDHSEYYAINLIAKQKRMTVEEVKESLERTKDKEI